MVSMNVNKVYLKRFKHCNHGYKFILQFNPKFQTFTENFESKIFALCGLKNISH